MKAYNRFPQQEYQWTRKLGHGNNSRVYALSGSHAAKVFDQKETPLFIESRTITEFECSNEWHEAGISVPRPEGVYTVKIWNSENLLGLFFPRLAYVMERIHGIGVTSLDGHEFHRVKSLFDREIEKAEKAGLRKNNPSIRDALYEPLTDNVYIIDFHTWSSSVSI